jgi:hypothetical protein
LVKEQGESSVNFDERKKQGDNQRPFRYKEYISSKGDCANRQENNTNFHNKPPIQKKN